MLVRRTFWSAIALALMAIVLVTPSRADEPDASPTSQPDDLVAQLMAPDMSVRFHAARQVAEERRADLIPALVPLLDDDIVQVRREAVYSLGRLGKNTDVVVQAFIKALADPADPVRRQALVALRNIGPKDETLLAAVTECLHDPTVAIRADAAKTLGAIAWRYPECLPDLGQALQDRAPQVRREAAEALRHINQIKPFIIGPLIRACGDTDPFVREEANQALFLARADDAHKTVDELRELMKAQDERVRTAALQVVSSLEERAVDVLPALIHCSIEDPITINRANAMRIIGDLETAGRPAAATLLDILKNDDEPELRFRAVAALRNLRPDPDSAGPILIAALSDEHSPVRDKAQDALQEIGADIVPQIIAVAGNAEPKLRQTFIEIIGSYKEASIEAVPLLISASRDADDDVRRAAIVAIRRIGPATVAATPRLIELLDDEDSNLYIEAAQTLGRIGPGAKAAIPSLIKALEHFDYGYSRAAATALGQMAPHSIDPLIATMKDGEHGQARIEATRALGLIGTDAKAAVTPLLTLLAAEDVELANHAETALRRIGKPSALAILQSLENRDDASLARRLEILVDLADLLGGSPDEVTALLAHDNPRLRETGISIVRKLGAEEPALMARLLPLFKDPVADIRSRTITVVGQLEYKQPDMAARLLSALKDDDEQVRISAANALCKFKDEHETILAPLLAALTSQSGTAQRAIAYTIKQIGGPAVEPVRSLLDHDDADVRWYAVDILGGIGAPARPALPDLRQRLEDEDATVRNNASWAIDAIGID